MSFPKKHPVLCYFVLTFAISFPLFTLAVGGPSGIPGTPEEIGQLLLPAILGLLAGPPVAGLVMTGLVYGKPGYKEMLSRLFRWRVGLRWWLVALLTAPLVFLTVMLSLSLISPVFLPGIFTTSDIAGLLAFGLVVGVMAGVFEEIGWTGFAIPALRKKYSVAATGLIMGVVWSVWHVLPAIWFSGMGSGQLSLISYILDPFLFLMMFRVLMVWVYDKTESLLVGMLMHVSITSSSRIIGSMGGGGAVSLLAFDLVWFASICFLVALARVGKGNKR